MDHLTRLNLIARITYYLGWIAGVAAALLHIAKFGSALQRTVNVSDRNLLQASLLLFAICMASELRALAYTAAGEMPSAARKQAA